MAISKEPQTHFSSLSSTQKKKRITGGFRMKYPGKWQSTSAHQCINMSALAAAQNGGSEGFTLKNYITNLAYPQAKNAVALSAK